MQVHNGTWRIKTLFDRRDTIEAQPVYQRGEVWNIEKRQLLIDSILRQFDIPKIYLRKLSGNAMFDYQIVDGQQRLNSIWQFLSPNGFDLLSDSVTPKSWRGKTFETLPSKLRTRIEEFQIVVAVIEQATLDEVRELFARLQKGMQLNPPELRNSMRSALGTAVRATAESHQFFERSPFRPHRFKYHDLAAHAYALELRGIAYDLKAPDLKSLYIAHKNSVAKAVATRVHRTLDYLLEMLESQSGCISRKWGFVDLCGVISVNRSRLPSASTLAARYVTFESKRLKYVGDPQRLLRGRAKDRTLYDYIEAFRLSAGTAKNMQQRHRVLARRLLR